MLDELARFNQARWTELVAADVEFARLPSWKRTTSLPPTTTQTARGRRAGLRVHVSFHTP